MLILGTIKISPGKGRCERKGGRTLACLRDYVSEQGGNGGPRNQRWVAVGIVRTSEGGWWLELV